jgi:signal transduction histidine kinase
MALPEAVANTAYLVIAEVLTNARKHSGASSLRVVLACDDGVLRVAITDDGVGGANPGSGLGMRGIADRIDTLGGRLRIESPSGQGTRIEVELPCAS